MCGFDEPLCIRLEQTTEEAFREAAYFRENVGRRMVGSYVVGHLDRHGKTR